MPEDSLNVLSPELREQIREIWAGRSDRYPEERTEKLGADRPARVEMYRIGG